MIQIVDINYWNFIWSSPFVLVKDEIGASRNENQLNGKWTNNVNKILLYKEIK